MYSPKIFVVIVGTILISLPTRSFAIDRLLHFKVNQATLISKNDISTIYIFGDTIKDETGKPQQQMGKLLPIIRQFKGIPQSWLSWFERIYGGQEKIGYKKLAAAIFYPYEVLEKTHKQHFQQMNYAFKASIMYSSVLDAGSFGRILRGTLKTDIGIDIHSKDDLLNYLDVGFIACNSSFLDKTRIYETSNPGTLDHLKQQILLGSSAQQALNMGLILQNLGKDKEALECFCKANENGSLRAIVEIGNIHLKKDFKEGLRFYQSQGAYGLWKLAQCFRYGINTERKLDVANDFYLQSIRAGDSPNYPEILFDSADFAVHYAYSQSDPEIFKKVMTSAVERFFKVGELHLELGYLRAAVVSLEVSMLFPDIMVSTPFTYDFQKEAAKRSLMGGHAAKATSILDKIHLSDDASMVVARSYAEQMRLLT